MPEPPPRQLADTARQMVTIVIVAVALFFAVGVAGRMVTLIHLKIQFAELQARRVDLRQQIDKLTGDINYMQTDSYVEQAARTMLLWGEPGEKLIITLGDSSSTATPVPQRRP